MSNFDQAPPPLSADVKCRSATGPDTLYSPQKYQNYSIIIVHLATKFIPQKQFHLHKLILDADLLLTFQSIQS